MLLLAADENLSNDIVRGLLRRKPELDIVRVQDAGLSGNTDPIVLEWCGVRTMAACCSRMMSGQSLSTPTSALLLVSPCRVSLKSHVIFPLAEPLKTFC